MKAINMEIGMNLSVIVPAYNAEKNIDACLKAIKASSYKDHEIIVVDDASSDGTVEIAKKYADKVISLPEHSGPAKARKAGWADAKWDTIVNIDSDVVVAHDTLSIIADYFKQHSDVDAVTGLLCKTCSHKNFSSQYKNLYMHYIFRKLPERVSFLYGSIFALRKNTLSDFTSIADIADDTALGQHLARTGKKISFLRDCEVTHLKEFTLGSLIRNDFQIPRDWALIFLNSESWKRLFRNNVGFAHSPKEQLVSVILAPVALLLSLVAAHSGGSISFIIFPILAVWFLFNFHFLAFLTKERGLFFGIKSLFFTFLDHLVMASGIIFGFISFFGGKILCHAKRQGTHP